MSEIWLILAMAYKIIKIIFHCEFIQMSSLVWLESERVWSVDALSLRDEQGIRK